jgi:NTP pyrophosphatase (non-canonical NTP hydrolase)
MARARRKRALEMGAFQAALAKALRGVEHPRVLATLALAEETGELVRCVLDAEGYGKDVRAELASEVGDVAVALAEVADRHGLSLAACARASLEKVVAKAPGWKRELGGRLEVLRRRMDGPVPRARRAAR